MNLIQALLMGFMQGLTEFLPVSSSGHIVLTSAIYKKLTGLSFTGVGGEEIFFDIMLHLGTLIAVLIYFRKDLSHLINVFCHAVKEKTLKHNIEAQIPLYIAVGTVATVAVVYPFKDFFESIVSNPSFVGLMLMTTGFMLYFTENFSQKFFKANKNLSMTKAIIIGLVQGIAGMPGISRSGSTISAGLATGLDRTTAARYSFLLSIPVIILAVIAQSTEIGGLSTIKTFNWTAILSGTLVAGVIGYYCIKYFIDFVGKHKLNVFAYYCWVIGLAMFIGFKFL